MIRVIGVFVGIIGFICLILGICTLIGVLPPLDETLSWEAWFWVSGLLFLLNIACVAGGSRRGGGEGY